MRKERMRYVAAALATIAVGLLVHLGGSGLDPVVRDVLGDALWAMMIVWWVSAITPGARLAARIAVAYAVCAAVELCQLYHTPGLDALRSTRLAGLVLGSGFDARDLAAYALGVASAACLVVVGHHRARRARPEYPSA
jgi:hypothetical protein